MAENTDQCEWLIDNAVAFDRIVRSIAGAKSSIRISQLAFEPDCIAYGTGHNPDISLAGVIAAASRDRGVDVRILMNQTLFQDKIKPLRRWFISHAAKEVKVRGVSRFPQLLHAKMVIVDEDEVFLLGSPFVNGYWDDSSHMPVDSRRPERELGGRPLHDVAIRLTGGPVAEAKAIFDDWWKTANGKCRIGEDNGDQPIRPKVRLKRTDAPVQLVTTCPGSTARRGRKEILTACLEGISRAQSLIYVEHQHLSSRPIVKALITALEKNKDLELVIVINQNPEVSARRWQNDRLVGSGLLNHARVGVYSLWTAEPRSGRLVLASQVFLHSKVLIVDDKWAMVGSANLDGVSLDSHGDDFAGPIARRVLRRVRNFDIDAVVRDGVDGVPANGLVASLRSRLWAEHLGMSPGATMLRPPSGWLALWRERARLNVMALDLNDTRHRFRGFVLPFSLESSPEKQWADLGIRSRGQAPALSFRPSWMDVHFSPGLVRNTVL